MWSVGRGEEDRLRSEYMSGVLVISSEENEVQYYQSRQFHDSDSGCSKTLDAPGPGWKGINKDE